MEGCGEGAESAVKGNPGGLCSAADNGSRGRKAGGCGAIACSRAVLQHHRERQNGVCLGCWAVARWRVGKRCSVRAFGGELGKKGRVKDGRACGMGCRKGCSKVLFAADKQSVDAGRG